MLKSRFAPGAAASMAGMTVIRKALAVVASVAVLTAGLVAMSAGPAMASGGWSITNLLSGRCIAPVNNNTADRNVTVVLSAAPCRITWSINLRQGSSDLWIISLDANSARCLVPSGSSQQNGAAIVTGACSTTAPFLWKRNFLEHRNNRDYYEWQNYLSQYCLTVTGTGESAGDIIAQQPCISSRLPTQWFTW